MNEVNKIVKFLKKHPKAFVYYTDNGAWTIYQDKQAFKDHTDAQDEDMAMAEYMENTIDYIEGDDSDFGTLGYAPTIVQAFAKLNGMEVDSI